MTLKNLELEALTKNLLKDAGFSNRAFDISRLSGGGNNQIYQINHPEKKLILKKYLSNSTDLRNRLESEFNFIRAVHPIAPKATPTAYCKNDTHLVGLYEFIEGQRIIREDEVRENFISQAASFIAKINARPTCTAQRNLKDASEANYSIRAHISRIDSRIVELAKIQNNNAQFKDLIYEIKHCWDKIKSQIILDCNNNNIPFDIELTQDDKVLSPSDFGFHNALLSESGNLVFIDFEYAGWDDPAKLVGDFFSQVAIPVDQKHIDTFIQEAFESFPNIEYHKIRSLIMLNAYKIKWCTIVLNVFIDTHLSRRIFANPNIDIEQLHSNQLKKANKILQGITQ
jgi:thiamine kinase-like enzyme